MSSVVQDFTSEEPRTFRFKIGRLLASSLSGFIAGVIVASIIWFIGVWYVNQIQKAPPHNPVVIASLPDAGR
ncbi:MAG TPA: hypothetical protein VMR99_01875 [Candidatus Paceibacterota bacterium]|nr:hypothetical protein [Candidatus Paceibacterota bacterium]